MGGPFYVTDFLGFLLRLVLARMMKTNLDDDGALVDGRFSRANSAT